jgi:hypothetical protein
VERPYLVLHVTGLNGESGDIIGIVDSGADITSLPLDYASLMGYAAADLRSESVEGVGGATSAFHATKPVLASVAGLDDSPFDLNPCFVDGNDMVLWGRSDFFKQFIVAFNENEQNFTIIRPD